ncbi:MAG: MarR family winged helix-turn-helix transcriptional regulator [Promethearchaeota archaeon]|jgi:DNA-binding MarR family transcriptional regulator
MSENDSSCDNDSCVILDFSEVFQLINTLNKKFDKLQRQVVKKDNLTPPQYSILTELWKSDGKQFKELASACCCSPSTVTGIIDTMEKNKLVYRDNNPNDRRSLLVKLTPKGKEIEKVTPQMKIVMGNCCEGVTPEEIDLLTVLLKKLSSSFVISDIDNC